MKQELHVCLCHDEGYLKYAAVLLSSIIFNAERISPQKKNKYKFVFHLLCDFLSDESKGYLPQIEKELSEHFECNIIYHQVNDSLFRKYKSWGFDGVNTYAAYLRFLIPEILDKNVDKCVYLDCDMMCYGDLTELFDIDLGDAIMGVSPDERALMKVLEFKGKKINRDFKHEYGKDECYFNSGLLLMNLKQWRKENITDKCLEVLNKYIVAFPDQDALNMALYDRVKFLPVSWNYNTIVKISLLEQKEKIKYKSENLQKLLLDGINSGSDKVNIYHYYGQPKPWWQVPFYFVRGQLSSIEECFLKPYLDMAFKTPVYGEYFSETLKINTDIKPLLLLKDYGKQLEKFLTIQYNRLKKKYRKVRNFFIISVAFHIVEFLILIYLLNKVG